MKIPRSAAYLVLVVLFTAAVYMVYIADGVGGWLPSRDLQGNVSDVEDADDDAEEAIFDDNDPAEWDLDQGEAFFIEYRLERERVRSRELDVLQQMINNPNVTEASKAQAETKLLELQELMELELLLENAVKAQGFANAVLIMQKDGAMVIVDAKELSGQQVVLIAQIAASSTGLRASQINISNHAGK